MGKTVKSLSATRALWSKEATCCEVWAGQYWRVENLKSFDEFLEKRFPESRRKAYYLMSIHEHLPSQARRDLRVVGWTEGLERATVAPEGRAALRLCNLFAQGPRNAQGGFQAEK